MKRIFKYQLDIIDNQIIKLPKGGKILSVHNQNETICIWAEIDDEEKETVGVEVVIVGTGNPMILLGGETFLGTVLHGYQSKFVWHIYYKFKEENKWNY